MAQIEIINIGASPNDQQGDPLRTAFSKTNNNFANLFNTFVNTSNTYTNGTTTGQVIFEAPSNAFSQGQFYIQSTDTLSSDTQTIQLSAQYNTSLDAVKFTGFGSTFFGNGLATFDMDVLDGNVRILCNPIVDTTMLHFIGSQILWVGLGVPGLELQLDGYANSGMSTENDFVVTTEN
jgi:hypothetical protein